MSAHVAIDPRNSVPGPVDGDHDTAITEIRLF